MGRLVARVQIARRLTIRIGELWLLLLVVRIWFELEGGMLLWRVEVDVRVEARLGERRHTPTEEVSRRSQSAQLRHHNVVAASRCATQGRVPLRIQTIYVH